MDFCSLSRRELQALCKLNKIPANLTNVAMANALSALDTVIGLDDGSIAEPEQSTPQIVSRSSNRRKQEVTGSEISMSVSRTARKTATERASLGSKAHPAEQVCENESLDPLQATPSLVEGSQRKARAVSARKKVNVESLVLTENRKNVMETPLAIPKPRRCAEPGSRQTNTKKEGQSIQRVYSTRRSMRLLEKSMESLNLEEKEKNIENEFNQRGDGIETPVITTKNEGSIINVSENNLPEACGYKDEVHQEVHPLFCDSNCTDSDSITEVLNVEVEDDFMVNSNCVAETGVNHEINCMGPITIDLTLKNEMTRADDVVKEKEENLLMLPENATFDGPSEEQQTKQVLPSEEKCSPESGSEELQLEDNNGHVPVSEVEEELELEHDEGLRDQVPVPEVEGQPESGESGEDFKAVHDGETVSLSLVTDAEKKHGSAENDNETTYRGPIANEAEGKPESEHDKECHGKETGGGLVEIKNTICEVQPNQDFCDEEVIDELDSGERIASEKELKELDSGNNAEKEQLDLNHEDLAEVIVSESLHLTNIQHSVPISSPLNPTTGAAAAAGSVLNVPVIQEAEFFSPKKMSPPRSQPVSICRTIPMSPFAADSTQGQFPRPTLFSIRKPTIIKIDDAATAEDTNNKENIQRLQAEDVKEDLMSMSLRQLRKEIKRLTISSKPNVGDETDAQVENQKLRVPLKSLNSN